MPPRLLDCASKNFEVLLQAERPAERIAIQGDKLFGSHHGRIIQYEWSHRRHAWVPLWVVVEYEQHSVESVDCVSQSLLLFRGTGIVERRHLPSAMTCGVWRVAHEVIGGGCAVENGSALMLSDESRGPESVDMHLVRVHLGRARDCEDLGDVTA